MGPSGAGDATAPPSPGSRTSIYTTPHVRLRGQTLSEFMKDSKRRKSGGAPRDAQFELTEPDKEIGRGRSLYSKWGKKWLEELVIFITDEAVKLAGDLDKDRLLEAVEYATDIRCTGAHQDKIQKHDLKKKDFFPLVKEVYIMYGKRLSELDGAISDGRIERPVFGHFGLKTTKLETGAWNIKIWCKELNKTIDVDEETIGEDDGPWILRCNWSLEAAYVEGGTDTYICQNFFPSLSKTRSLRRQTSTEKKVISTVGGVVDVAKTARTNQKRSREAAFETPPLIAPLADGAAAAGPRRAAETEPPSPDAEEA